MPSNFDQPEDDNRIPSVISSEDGASELYLIDRSYNEIARGVGELHLDLTPGPYKVRQRIGDTEQITSFTVDEGSDNCRVEMTRLDYASPVPVKGTNTYQDLWSIETAVPFSKKPGLRIVIRDPDGTVTADEKAFEHLRYEVGRLRIETLPGKTVLKLAETQRLDTNKLLFFADIDLEPGYYVLVQEAAEDQQLCLPLFVHKDWWPEIFMLSLRDKDAENAPLGIQLDNASITFRHAGAQQPADDIARGRLEAARKALGRGRTISGWSTLNDPVQKTAEPQNPMLALIDAHLLVVKSTPENIATITTLIQSTTAALGPELFPDVLALQIALYYAAAKCERKAKRNADGSTKESKTVLKDPPLPPDLAHAKLSGPPLLHRSWHYLLRGYRSTKTLSDAMPFQFTAEPTSGWFIWSEQVGSRNETCWNVSNKQGVPASPVRSQMVEAAKQVLQTLASSEEAHTWLTKLQKAIAENSTNSNALSDPLVQKLATSLGMLADPVLRKIMNSDELVKNVLHSQGLTDERLESTLQKFVKALDENKLLTGLVVVGVSSLAIKLIKLFMSSSDDKRET